MAFDVVLALHKNEIAVAARCDQDQDQDQDEDECYVNQVSEPEASQCYPTC